MPVRTALPCDAQSVRAARRFVTTQLAEWGIDPGCRDNAELLVSELVSNAILHARTALDLDVRRAGDGVRVSVTDRSPRGLVRKRHTLGSATGRGLILVEQLSAAWGVDVNGNGKTVWFEVRPGMVEPEPDVATFLTFERAP